MIGPITLDVKCAGARSAGNPHAACDVEGAGNGATDTANWARRGKPWIQTSVCPDGLPRQLSTLPFGRLYSARTGQARLGYRPSKQSIKRMVRKIHALTAEATSWQETTALVGKLNRMLRGWANYFNVGTVSRAYRALDNYTTMRLRRWLRNKHKVRRSGYTTYPDVYLYETLRLVRLSRLGCDVPWTKA
jgi:hypothetical protein